ncbi:transcription factor MYB93-like [Vitis riparia]|uniref:transcription factor MYB93-like n=1 Tax=Vitis riparia TaxID=96939 RepID=UPI00155AAA85|nr:transcription factor MYB93-like [Vitis riparia]XP_034680370.1 transcription factor MYB93-like [Vitis riparia]
MARTQQKKSLWTPEEDDKLKEVRHKYPNLSWPAIAKQAELNRTGKSCWERWENNLNPDINKDEFSREEDDIIIQQMSLPQNSWASMAKNDLRGRAPNAIKNRWNNHLKKRHATISDLRRHLLYLEEHLMDDEASDHSVWGGDLEALMAEFASLIPNVDPSAISSIPEYTS